jgi:hypothetical protein
MPSKFNLREIVVNNRLGPVTTGTIIGILDAESINEFYGVPLDRWDNFYPRWISRDVYLVKTNNPQKSMSIQEYLLDHPGDYAGYNDLPEQTYFIFPEQDLVSFDDLS